jgi:hypothetical protein
MPFATRAHLIPTGFKYLSKPFTFPDYFFAAAAMSI